MQIHRLFRIVYLLLEQESMTAGELASHLEVAARTIYRDVEALAEAGIPIYATKGKGGGIRLTEQFVLGKAVLTAAEREEVFAALQGLQAVRQAESDSALEKLSALFGGAGEDWLMVDFGRWDTRNVINDRFQLLKEAIFKRRVLSFDYSAAEKEPSRRQVEAMKLVFRGCDWYLWAWCRLREDFRYFKLTRMSGLVMESAHFARRPIPPDEPPSPPAVRASVDVTVVIAPQAAYRLSDDFYPLALEARPDGRLQAKLTLEDGAWLYEYLLTYGDLLEVAEPPAVREALCKRLAKALAQYQRGQ